MDIQKELSKGNSKAVVNRIVNHIGAEQEKFDLLVEIFLNGPYRITQRAAWPLAYCAEKNPFLVKKHLKTILDYLNKPGLHDAVKRNTIRLLQFIEIQGRYQGRVATLCFKYLQDPTEPIAVRVFSMTVLANLSKQHHDMKGELRIAIENHLPFASAAFISRAKKVLKALGRE